MASDMSYDDPLSSHIYNRIIEYSGDMTKKDVLIAAENVAFLVCHDCGTRIAENLERISITVTTFGSKRTVCVTVHEQTRPTEQSFCNIVHAELDEHDNIVEKLAMQVNDGVARILRKRGSFYSMYGGTTK